MVLLRTSLQSLQKSTRSQDFVKPSILPVLQEPALLVLAAYFERILYVKSVWNARFQIDEGHKYISTIAQQNLFARQPGAKHSRLLRQLRAKGS